MDHLLLVVHRLGNVVVPQQVANDATWIRAFATAMGVRIEEKAECARLASVTDPARVVPPGPHLATSRRSRPARHHAAHLWETGEVVADRVPGS